MIEMSSTAPVRAEHESLSAFLRAHLTADQLARPLIASFSQWELNVAVVGEIAAVCQTMNVDQTVAMWADETPMPDIGWTTSHNLARIFLSPARDQRVIKALRDFGVPKKTFARPPIKGWRPQGRLPEIQRLNRSSIRRLTYRGARAGKAVLQVHPDDQTPVTDDHLWPRRWVEESLLSFAYAYDQTLNLMQNRKSTCLIAFNGRFLHDAAAVEAAKELNVPVLSFDYGGNETDYDLTVGAVHDWSGLQTRMKDLYAGWDPREREEIGSRWFENRRRHIDERNSLYVESQVIGRMPDLPKTSRLVVFFSSSGDEISELDLDWGNYFEGQPGALSAVARVCRERDDTVLVVRTHPHKRMKPRRDVEDWHHAVVEASPDIHIDEWADVDSYALMDAADVVITYGSTTGVEAAFAKKPVIVMGPSAYDELECATRVSSESELRNAMAAMCVGQWSGALAYGLMMNRRGFNFDHLNGQSGSQTLAGRRIKASNEFVLKVSDWMKNKKLSQLTEVGQE